MEGSFYGINELFGATKELSLQYETASLPSNTQQPLTGIYQVEESVDFSALVEACEKNISPLSTTSTLGSSGFFETDNFDNFEPFLPPEINMYNNDMTTRYTPQQSLSIESHHPTNGLSLSLDSTLPLSFHSHPPTLDNSSITSSLLTGNQPITSSQITMGASPLPSATPSTKPSRTKTSTKKSLSKDSEEYRDKRERNNVAVRKSRNKSKQRVLETEKRVKELEDENTQLQNKITVLSKELNVLKSLFASAGVVQPPVKMEDQSSTACQSSLV